jgi:hypothetical protein
VTFNLPFGLYGFRFWMLFAFSAALIAPLGVEFLGRFTGRQIAVLLAVIGIAWTSGAAMYQLNTTVWYSPGIHLQDALAGNGYAWIKGLEPGTKVFEMSRFTARVHGFDTFSCDWCPEVMALRDSYMNMTVEEFHTALKGMGYEYVVGSQHVFRHYDAEKAQELIEEMTDSSLFRPVHSAQNVIIFMVN